MNRTPRLLGALLLSVSLGCGGAREKPAEETPWNRITVEPLAFPAEFTGVTGVSNDGSVMALRGTPGVLGVKLADRVVRYEVGGTAQFTKLSANGAFAVAFSRVLVSDGSGDELTLYLWDRERGPRPVVTRKGRILSVRELRGDGSFVAAFSVGGGYYRTIRFRLPDVVEESDGPPPDPPIPIVAPPGHTDATALTYSDGRRFAVGWATDADGRRHPCRWSLNGPPLILPSLVGGDDSGTVATHVSDDGERATLSAYRTQALWIRGRDPAYLRDLLKKAGEPDWEDPLWSFSAMSANFRFLTINRGDGNEYLVRSP
ncbi:MAG: hypothetical protein KIS66_05240 [Fimbriimonadaceae bacterium]|nr:hypothetical protein [Fimbriimonadaceae bacterium]